MCTIKDNVHQGLLDTQCNVEETLILFFCAKHQAFWESHQFFFSLAASFLFHFSSSDDFVLLLIPFNLQAIEFTPRLLFFCNVEESPSVIAWGFFPLLNSKCLLIVLLAFWYLQLLQIFDTSVGITGNLHRNLCLWHHNVSFYYCSDLQLQNAVLHRFCLLAKELRVSVDFATVICVSFLSSFFSLTSSLAVFFWVLSYHVNGSFVLGLRVECYRGSWVGGVGWSIREAKIDRTLLAWTLHGACQSCQLPPQAHPSKLSFPSGVFWGGG